MREITLRQLEEIIKPSDKYFFTDDNVLEGNDFYEIDDVVSDLIYWCCGEYEFISSTYIHHFDRFGKYIDTYCLSNPDTKEQEELKLYCRNWQEIM